MPKWTLTVHGNGFTHAELCDSELDAEAAAYSYMSRGVRVGDRIFPTSNIVFCELTEEKGSSE